MSDEIKVQVVKYPDRANLVLRYVDPFTGKHRTKSAGTGNERDAQKAAGKWQAELREGRYSAPSRITWADFRTRYEDEVLASLAETTDKKVSGVFNAIEKHISPQRLADVTASRLSYLQSKLRDAGRSESTIKGHMAHIAAALAWAVSVGLLAKAPKVTMPKRAKASSVMKGRPLTGEEFDRMLDKVGAVVGEAQVESWKHYLRGLWWSGLRLAESLELCWDREDKLCVDLSGKRPMLRIPAALEKGNQDRLLPVAPEFAEFLLATDEDKRTGYVFAPAPERTYITERLAEGTVIRLICEIGRKAGIKTLAKPNGSAKFASAHDLRRSFGARWASRVMPQVLMELMRHESIETTLKYYVGRNAQSTADVLWAAVATKTGEGNTQGNKGCETPKTGEAAETTTAGPAEG